MRKRKRFLWKKTVAIAMIFFMITTGFIQPASAEGINPPIGSPELVNANAVSSNAFGGISKDGQPVVGALMNARTAAGAEIWYDATTDANGNYQLYLPDGEYQIVGVWVASESKWYPLEVSITVQNGAAVNPERLNLDLTEKKPNVNGSVKKDGQPVAGALMNVRTATGAEKWYDATTDANGNYQLYMPDGEYQITGVWAASESKWYPLEVAVTVQNGAVVNQEQLNLDLTEKGPNVNGSVLKAGQGVAGALINARTASGPEKWFGATTDENGNYQLYLKDGEYQIIGVWVASESKWYPLEVAVTVQNGTVANPEQLNLNLTEKGPNVNGSVLKNNQPVAGALMNARTAAGAEKWYDATTDTEGNYQLYLPDGEYQITGVWVASESKWYPLEISVTVQNGAVVNPEQLNLALTDKAPNVNGSVLKDGQPVAGALMNARTATGAEKWYDATTDADGNYQLYMPDGEYEVIGVWVESEQNWYPLNLTFSVLNGVLQGQSDLTIDLIAKPGGNVNGLVADENGAAINGGNIGVIDLNDPDPYNTRYWAIDETGQFSLELPDGDYKVTAINLNNTGTKLIPMQVSFSVQNGGVVLKGEPQEKLNLQLPSINFSGQLLQSGQPLADSMIYLSADWTPDYAHGFVVFTDEWDGRFSERLGDGNYTITGIDTPLAYIEYHREFQVVNGIPSFDFTSFDISEGNNVQGRVQTSTGSEYAFGGSLEIKNANGEWYYADTNSKGEFSLLLPNGDYTITSFWSNYDGYVDLQNLQLNFSVENDVFVGESLDIKLPIQ